MKFMENVNTLIPILYIILNSPSPTFLKIINENINAIIRIIVITLLSLISYCIYLYTLKKKYFVKMEGYVSCLVSPYYGMNIQYEFSDEINNEFID